MAARIAGFAAKANQTVRFHSVQFGGLPNQINALGVVQDRLFMHLRFCQLSRQAGAGQQLYFKYRH
jgi:hypothetical protein